MTKLCDAVAASRRAAPRSLLQFRVAIGMQLHFDMHAIRRRTILVLWPAILPLLAAAKLAAAREPAPTTAPGVPEFRRVWLPCRIPINQPNPWPKKLDKLLRTPILSNQAALSGGRPHRPSMDGIGPVLRVASWNIERGLNFDLIKLALSDPDGFKQAALERGALEATKQARIEQQLSTLRDADIVFAERSGSRHEADRLSRRCQGSRPCPPDELCVRRGVCRSGPAGTTSVSSRSSSKIRRSLNKCVQS